MHPGYLPIQIRDDFAHSFGSTSGGRDDVLASATAISPQLAGGAVHGLLCGCDGMNSALWGGKKRADGKRMIGIMHDLFQGTY